jgi:hypothetical protein
MGPEDDHETAKVTECPDCSAPLFIRGESGTPHDPMCPFSAAIDAVTQADREWFESHPSAAEYYRPMAKIEGVEQAALQFGLTMTPPGHQWIGRVRVVKVAPDLRIRHFDGVELRCAHGPELMMNGCQTPMEALRTGSEQLAAQAGLKPGQYEMTAWLNEALERRLAEVLPDLPSMSDPGVDGAVCRTNLTEAPPPGQTAEIEIWTRTCDRCGAVVRTSSELYAAGQAFPVEVHHRSVAIVIEYGFCRDCVTLEFGSRVADVMSAWRQVERPW